MLATNKGNFVVCRALCSHRLFVISLCAQHSTKWRRQYSCNQHHPLEAQLKASLSRKLAAFLVRFQTYISYFNNCWVAWLIFKLLYDPFPHHVFTTRKTLCHYIFLKKPLRDSLFSI